MADDVVLDAITNETKEEVSQDQELKERKLSCQKLRRYDSLDIESRSFHGPHHGHHSKVLTPPPLPKNLHIPHHTHQLAIFLACHKYRKTHLFCIVWHIKFTSFGLTFFWFCLGYGLVNDLASSISKYWSGVRGCWYITTIRVFQHLPQWYLAQRRYPRSTFFDLLYHHLNYSHQVRVDCFMG